MRSTIQSQQKRVNGFVAIAKAQVKAKEFTDARKTAQRIKFP